MKTVKIKKGVAKKASTRFRNRMALFEESKEKAQVEFGKVTEQFQAMTSPMARIGAELSQVHNTFWEQCSIIPDSLNLSHITSPLAELSKAATLGSEVLKVSMGSLVIPATTFSEITNVAAQVGQLGEQMKSTMEILGPTLETARSTVLRVSESWEAHRESISAFGKAYSQSVFVSKSSLYCSNVDVPTAGVAESGLVYSSECATVPNWCSECQNSSKYCFHTGVQNSEDGSITIANPDWCHTCSNSKNLCYHVGTQIQMTGLRIQMVDTLPVTQAQVTSVAVRIDQTEDRVDGLEEKTAFYEKRQNEMLDTIGSLQSELKESKSKNEQQEQEIQNLKQTVKAHFSVEGNVTISPPEVRFTYFELVWFTSGIICLKQEPIHNITGIPKRILELLLEKRNTSQKYYLTHAEIREECWNLHRQGYITNHRISQEVNDLQSVLKVHFGRKVILSESSVGWRLMDLQSE